jgi:hypothetical protein
MVEAVWDLWEIEAKQAPVAGNRELIERFEKVIPATPVQVW